jgi:hypothetical protein
MIVTIKEFKESEFACQCGYDCGYGYQDMDEEFLSKLFTARKLSPIGFTLTSAVRCPMHPLAIKRPTSSHNANRTLANRCCAVDIAAVNSSVVFELDEALRKAGFTRLGWNQDSLFIHVDSDKRKPQRVFFSY